jgi:hypothetical protein
MFSTDLVSKDIKPQRGGMFIVNPNPPEYSSPVGAAPDQ